MFSQSALDSWREGNQSVCKYGGFNYDHLGTYRNRVAHIL